MARGFVYLCAVMDWFARRILAWRPWITMEADFLQCVVERFWRTVKYEEVYLKSPRQR
jgi:transposase InsO family protein